MKTKQIKEALKEFFFSEEGERIIGQIVIKAVNQALAREIQFEDRKADPGNPKIKTENWNVLDWLCKYLPSLEGAMRGVQNDADQARNRAIETRDMVARAIEKTHMQSSLDNNIIEIESHPTKRATGKSGADPLSKDMCPALPCWGPRR